MRSNFCFDIVLIAVVCCMGVSARAAAPNPFPAAYCTHTGGVVQTRIPEYNTNGGTPLVLAGPREFCQWTDHNGGSTINVLLTTLVDTKPSLAVLAYYAQVPFNGANCQGSPGSCYCSQLGGTDLFGGINAAGGGWVLKTDHTDTLDACIFPDLSSIDAYGLFYHSAGIIRGTDLSKVLLYRNGGAR